VRELPRSSATDEETLNTMPTPDPNADTATYNAAIDAYNRQVDLANAHRDEATAAGCDVSDI